MTEKILALIMVDGMRPDSLIHANCPNLKRLLQMSAYTLQARTVLPSLTLPCITSLFLGVPPQIHGTDTNTFTSTNWDTPGLIDLLHTAGYKTAVFNNWEPLRDLSRPGSLDLSICLNTSEAYDLPLGQSDDQLLSLVLPVLSSQPLNFIFFYLGCLDTAGHMHGWMSPEYISTLENADRCIGEFLSALPLNATFMITADHGGLGHGHGDDSEQEMLIPLITNIPDLPLGTIQHPVSILDIAPTIASYFGLNPPSIWQGKSLFS